MNETVIYTVLLGGYGLLYTPEKYSKDIDYFCFTDDMSLESEVWNIVKHPTIQARNERIKSRFLKICPHKSAILRQYTYGMYTDANTILKEVPNIIGILGDSKISIKTHDGRNNIADEAFACCRAKLDKVEIIYNQMESYKQQGIDINNTGLFACGTIFRYHNHPEIMKLGEEWWDHVSRLYSCRDQLSFPVVYRNYPVKHFSRIEYNRIITLIKKHYRREDVAV